MLCFLTSQGKDNEQLVTFSGSIITTFGKLEWFFVGAFQARITFPRSI